MRIILFTLSISIIAFQIFAAENKQPWWNWDHQTNESKTQADNICSQIKGLVLQAQKFNASKYPHATQGVIEGFKKIQEICSLRQQLPKKLNEQQAWYANEGDQYLIKGFALTKEHFDLLSQASKQKP